MRAIGRLGLTLLATLISGGVLAETDPHTEDWQFVLTAENGEIYYYDRVSIGQSDNAQMPAKTVSIRVENFKGHPDADELWAGIAVYCVKPAYRTILAIGSKGESLVAMPQDPPGSWKTAKNGTPMAAIMTTICAVP